MKRYAVAELRTWLEGSARRPLVLRGARQVGKTWAVRELANRCGRRLVELNFERDPLLRRLFASNDPRTILGEIALALDVDFSPGGSLLFLDEIQAAGDLLAKLRWFYEEMPELPVVAAGSLLEFTLADHTFSMPVGRVAFRRVEPMSFPEYLEAHGQTRLLRALNAWRPGRLLSSAAHDSAARWFHRYAMVGGMPAVVAADVAGRGPRACRELQRDLVATYRADFAKYAGRMDRDILNQTLTAVAAAIGRKFVYARAGEGVKQHQAKRALELLGAAELCTIVRYSPANGPPLAAESKDSFRKAVLVDVGVLHGILGTPASTIFPALESLVPTMRAQLIEQVAAQQLRLVASSPGSEPELFYWQREGGRPGEIDYILQVHGRIVPVEIKSGPAGAMKSLHQFMFDKKLGLAIRVDANPPGRSDLAVVTTQRNRVAYRLISLPHYLVGNLAAILADDDG